VAVDVAGALEQPGEGEEQSRRDHRQQVNGGYGAGRRSGRDPQPVGEPGESRGECDDQSAGDRQQGAVGHLGRLDAERAEDEHRHPDAVGADAGVGERRMRGVAREAPDQIEDLRKQRS
jgi:hypothetical protein